MVAIAIPKPDKIVQILNVFGLNPVSRMQHGGFAFK
jgi:hypothetical protein